MGVDLTIVHMDPTDLHPYERNPRDNDGAVRRMLEAILEYGFVVPVIATADGRVIDGHLRLKAALRGKLTSIPVAIVGDLTEAQAQALRLSINRMGELADWNPELLAMELEELASFHLTPIGFEDFDLELPEINLSESLDPDEEDERTPGRDNYRDVGEGAQQAEAKTRPIAVPVMVELPRADYKRWREWRGARSDSDALIDAIAILTGGQI